MNTTTARKSARCYVCNTRKATMPRHTFLDMCHVCYDIAGLENEHADGFHTEPITNCPVCVTDDAAVEITSATPAGTPKASSTVDKTGTHVCGGCATVLPVTKFPTTRTKAGVYVRNLDRCRTCRKGGAPKPATSTRARVTTAEVTRTGRAPKAPRPVAAAQPGHPGHDALARRMFADAFRTAGMIRPRAERVA